MALKKVLKNYITHRAEFDPTWALSQGIEGYEARVVDLSKNRIANYVTNLKELRQLLKKLPPQKTGTLSWLEQELLGSDLKLKIWEWSQQEKYLRDPTLYVSELVYGLWYCLLRIPSKAQKIEACLAKLRASEQLFEAAQSHLSSPPKIWVKIALEEIQGFGLFLEEVRQELYRLAPKRKIEIDQAILVGQKTQKHFEKLLKSTRFKRSPSSFSVGEKTFNFLLKNYHHFSQNAAQVYQWGLNQVQEIQKKLKEQSLVLDQKSTWMRQMKKVKQDHPSFSDLMPTYQNELKALKAFLRRKKILTLPHGEQLRVIPTPIFSRATIPFAAYLDPPMFSGKNLGHFFVTPPPENSADKLEEVLQEHNFSSIKVTALHEAYPGHHSQFAFQKTINSIMGKIFNCSSFYEGWTLYCEEMMYEVGYYNEQTRLLQLRDKLWRACRVVIDVGLHCGQMKEKEAVSFLAKTAKMSRISAQGEINWYTLNPTVPQSYLMGMHRVFQLRKKYRENLGASFTLSRFHEKLLSFGAIPVPLVEKMMLS